MSCKKRNNILVLSVLFVILLINVLSFFKEDTTLKLEILKVWWKENMKLVKQLYNSPEYIQQQTIAIEQALSQINMVDQSFDDALDVNNLQWNDSFIQELERIKSSSIIYGDENARFTIIEYSEFLCPFCKRHSQQWTIRSVVEQYPNEVNKIFRNFIVSSQAAKLWEVLLCFSESKPQSKYDFIKEAFSYEDWLTVEVLIEISWKLGANKTQIQECVNSNKYTQEINNQTNEWRNLFGVNWTPGNVIIDKETWKFVVIPWAYPVEKFIEEIEKLKNN